MKEGGGGGGALLKAANTLPRLFWPLPFIHSCMQFLFSYFKTSGAEKWRLLPLLIYVFNVFQILLLSLIASETGSEFLLRIRIRYVILIRINKTSGGAIYTTVCTVLDAQTKRPKTKRPMGQNVPRT